MPSLPSPPPARRLAVVALALAALVGSCERRRGPTAVAPVVEPPSQGAAPSGVASGATGEAPPGASASGGAPAAGAPGTRGRRAANDGLATAPADCELGQIVWSPVPTRLALAGCGAPLVVDLGASTAVHVLGGYDHGMSWSGDGNAVTTGEGSLFVAPGFSQLLGVDAIEVLPGGTGASVSFYPRSTLSADGDVFLVSNAQSRMWFFDARTGKHRKTTRDFVSAPATGSTTSQWSPRGARVLSLTDAGELRLLGPKGDVLKLLDRSGEVAWSPSGASFAVAARDGVYLYKSSGERIRRLQKSVDAQEPSSMSFSDDGRLLFVRGSILKLDGSVARALPGATSVAFSPDGSAVLWEEKGAVLLAKVEGGAPPVTLRAALAGDGGVSMGWLPDGRRVFVGMGKHIDVVDVESRASALPGLTASAALGEAPSLSADGAWLAVAGRELQLVRTRDGKQFFVRIERQDKSASAFVYGVDRAFSGSAEAAARILRRDGRPLPPDELSKLAQPDLLAR
jgi:WD40 repeat protein